MSEQQTVAPQTPAVAWKKVGRWAQGTAVAAAVGQGPSGIQRLVAAPAGLYTWGIGAPQITPLLAGVVDPNIVALAVVGRGKNMTVLAATATGRLLRAQAPGLVWNEVTTWAGLGVATVLAPAPGEAQRSTLFVGTPAGIFRTLDAGHSWESCNFGLLDEEILCLAVAPTYDTTELLWAGTAGGGFYRSRNGGRAWRESGVGLPDTAVQALAVSPDFAEDQTLYAGLEDDGVYRSTDGGETWVPWVLQGSGVNALACGYGGTLWAGTSSGLFAVSLEGQVTPHLDAGLPVLTVAAGLGREVLVGTFGRGVYSSTDSGGTWHPVDIALHAPPVVVTSAEGLVALDNGGALAISRDRGATWVDLPAASDEGVFDIAAARGAPDLFAATGSGLLRLGAAGWEPVAADRFAEKPALAVNLSPAYAQDRSILAVVHDDDLLLSEDGGATWREVTGPWGDQNLLRAQFGPGDGESILVLTVTPTDTGHFSVAVWQGQGRGRNWVGLATLTTGLPAVLAAWPADPAEQAIFLATQHRVIKLFHAAGELQVHQAFFVEGERITALAADAEYATSGTLWAATTERVMQSRDRGQSWLPIAGLPDGVPLMALDAAPGRLRAVVLGGSVWDAALAPAT